MRPQSSYNPQQMLRNSYGFQPSGVTRNFQPKTLNQHTNALDKITRQSDRNITNMIKNLQTKIQGVEYLASKKKNHSNIVSEQTNQQQAMKSFNNNERDQNSNNNNGNNRYIGLPSEMRGVDLRGSCPNTYKRENLRNTVSITQHPQILQLIRKQTSPRRKQSPAEQNQYTSIPSNKTYYTNSVKDFDKKANESSFSRLQKNIFNSVTTESSSSQVRHPTKNRTQTDSPNSKGSEKVQFTSFSSLNQILAKKQQIKQKMDMIANKPKNLIVGEFQLGRILGKGKFGQVYLAKHVSTGFIVALKKIVKNKVQEYKMIDQLKNQIRLHSSLIHPNIVRFFGMFEDSQEIYLVMEYMNGGTLFDYLNEKDTLPLKEAVQFLRDTITALQYLHDRSIAHRDIKPENIVLSSQGVAKLCDFGWSALVQNSRKTYCGTFDYAPPQILERKNYDASVDIWCIGVLTYEILAGKVPFQGEKRNVIMDKIINVDKNKMEFPQDFPIDARSFVESLVRKDPEERPKCKDLLKYPLFTNNPSISQNKTKKP